MLISCPSSTPGSANYGKHMSAEEVVDFFSPEQTTIDAVMEWLASSGISPKRFAISANKQVLPHSWFPNEVFGPLFHTMNTNGTGSSGSNLTQQPPKLKTYSSPTSTSGSMLPGPMIFRVKSIMCQPTSKSTLTT